MPFLLQFLPALARILHGGADKFAEERVRRVGAGFEFGMELHSHEEGVCGNLHRLDEAAVRRGAGDLHARLFKLFPVLVVELEAVAVPLGNILFAVCLFHLRAFGDAQG